LAQAQGEPLEPSSHVMQRLIAAAAAWLLSSLVWGAGDAAVVAAVGNLRAASQTVRGPTSGFSSGPAPRPAPELAPAPALEPAWTLAACERWCDRVLLPSRCTLEGVCSGCSACAGAAPAPQPMPASALTPDLGSALAQVWVPFERSSCASASDPDPFWRGWLHNPVGTVAGCKKLCETSRDTENRPCVAIEVYTQSANDEAQTLHCNLAWDCSTLRPWNSGMVLRRTLGSSPPPLPPLAETLPADDGAQDVVSLEVRLEGLDYVLLASGGLLGDVEVAIKAAVADEAEVAERDVSIELWAGSVIARVTIALPAGTPVTTAASQLAATPTLSASLLSAVCSISGISAATTGIAITVIVKNVLGFERGVQVASASFELAPAPALDHAPERVAIASSPFAPAPAVDHVPTQGASASFALAPAPALDHAPTKGASASFAPAPAAALVHSPAPAAEPPAI